MRKTVDDLETTIQSTLETCTEYQQRNKWKNSEENLGEVDIFLVEEQVHRKQGKMTSLSKFYCIKR